METTNHFINKEDSMELEIIKESSIALVREFLNRKGCKKSLAALDEEIPRNSSSICNRAELAQAIHVSSLIQKNKKSLTPFRTIIEMIIWDLIKNFKTPVEKGERPMTATVKPNSKADVTELNESAKPHRPSSSRAHNPSINPMIVSGLRVARPPHKSKNRKQASSVAEMLSASPEKVISCQEYEEQRLKKEEKTLRVEHVKSPGILKPDTILQDLDDCNDIIEDKWSNEKLNYKFNTNGNQNNSMQKSKFNRTVGFHLAPSGGPLDFDMAQKLRKLVFGSLSRTFPESWINQPFRFCECNQGERLRYGIIQNKGGPCGLLAAVQAHVLKHLLFGKNDERKKSGPSCLDVSSNIRTISLSEAIVEILWRAGGKKRAIVALPSSRYSFTPTVGYKEDGITEYLITTNCQTIESLHEVIYNNIDQFERGKSASILLFYSAILSRGINEVTQDMDDPSNTLLGAHSYCTQEMVNLLTVGVAASNTFNNEMRLHEDILLRGITSRSDIGLFSLFEHYGSCSVGNYLKTPRYPIWIVCSESHFSVLFSLNREVVDADWSDERVFDLYYYDGLANQDEEIKFTVDTNRKSLSYEANDLISPLELCIRTKWPDCNIDWNGTEPLL